MDNEDDGHEDLQDDLLDFTIIGASHLAHGKTDFSLWSKAMLAEGDLSIRPFLSMLFQNSKDMLHRIQTLGEPSRTRGGNIDMTRCDKDSPERCKSREELAGAEKEMNAFLEERLQSGSALQAEFATRYKRYRIENPEYFDDSNWVEKLQAECRRDLPSDSIDAA